MEATWMSASHDHRWFDPFRAPDWRWRRAAELLTAGRRPLVWEDPAIGRARIFQRDLAREADYKGICKRQPDLAAAYSLYTRGGISRDEVEARLLAGESPAVIASKVSVSVEAVIAYEGYFFNVAHCLNAHDWLMSQAVFPGPGRASAERNIWCYWALAGGPAMVDLLVADYVRGSRRSADMPHATLKSSAEAEKARYLVREFCADSSSPKDMAALLKEGSRLFKVGSKAFRQSCNDNSVAAETFRLKLSYLDTAYGVRRSARSRVRRSKSQAPAKAASPVSAKTQMASKQVAEASTASKAADTQVRQNSAILAERVKDEVRHDSDATAAHAPHLGRDRRTASRSSDIPSSLTVITRLAEEQRRSAAMATSQATAKGAAGKAADADDAMAGDVPNNVTKAENTHVTAAAA